MMQVSSDFVYSIFVREHFAALGNLSWVKPLL